MNVAQIREKLGAGIGGAGGIEPERRLSGSAKLSLTVHWCFIFGSSMSGVFLNLYLWRLTESLWVNGMYLVYVFLVTPPAFAVGGWLAKRYGSMTIFRAGIALTALFYLLVIVIREGVVDWYPLFAFFGGVAGSFYWLSYITLMYDVSTEQNRLRYLGLNMITFTTANLAGPALAGSLITANGGLAGYIWVFGLSFAMFMITTVVSLKLHPPANHHKAYYLKFTGILLKKHREWRHMLYAFLSIGVFQGIILFLPNILLYEAVKREDLVGYLGIGLSSVTIATGWVLSKYARERYARVYVLCAAFGLTAASIVLLVGGRSLPVVLTFLCLQNISLPLIFNTLSAYQYRQIGRLPLKGNLKIEAVVMREAFLNVGRIAGIAAVLALAVDLSSDGIGYVLVVSSILQFVLYKLVKKE